jgi:hypothetical protein
MSETKHIIGKLHRHGTEIHIQDGPPCKFHACIADTNEALTNKEFYAEEIVQRWNSHDDLVTALEAWQLMDSESGDKHPCPDYVLRSIYRDKARKLTEAALAKAKKQGNNKASGYDPHDIKFQGCDE